MSYSVSGTTISLTRGDTLKANIIIKNSDGSKYIPEAGDTISFALKKDYDEVEPLIQKNIPTDTLLLKLDPADTKELSFGEYVYDVQLTKANGDVDTFITRAKLKLKEEVN